MFGLLRRGAAFAAIVASGAVALAGCGSDIKGDHADLVRGKQLFVQRCGACHTLSRAATRGTVGPNLDQAFVASLGSGFRRSVVRGVVEHQILYPNVTGKMPGKLVTGQDATDVSAYVAYAVAKGGQDSGALASAVRSATQRTAAAQGGKLQIDTDPNGQLAYQVSSATASAGALRSTRETPPPRRTTSPSRRAPTAECSRSARSSRAAASRPSRSTSDRADTRSTAPSRATARAAWSGRSPSDSGAAGRRLLGRRCCARCRGAACGGVGAHVRPGGVVLA